MHTNSIKLKSPKGKITAKIKLVSSKSESNRALIINSVGGNKCNLDNLSTARDTQTMKRLLSIPDQELNVIDAGTTMRFLTALMAIRGEDKIMTGTERMCERPIGLLVNALRELGADITYLNKEGYPPLKINAFKNVATNHIKIKGDVSSQYISAIVMVSPLLPNGLRLELEGKIASRPYIEMTLDLMRHFGVQSRWEGNTIVIEKQEYSANSYKIESDWSGASYWYSIVALAEEAEIELIGLKENSLQGDSALVELMSDLGVKSEFTQDGVLLTKKDSVKEKTIDFSNCPDIAQTLAVIAAAKGIKLTLTGLESLRIKETDRIAAIQNELQKMGADMKEVDSDLFVIESGTFSIGENTSIATYDDHRMAMAFAPLALLKDIEIENPDVVKKSYPSYWEDLQLVGFNFNIVEKA